MLSDLELAAKVFVRRKVLNGKTTYCVISDGAIVLETPIKQAAYSRQREERERLSIEEALYDAELKIRPEKLLRRQLEVKRKIYIQNPDIWRDFPIAWKVYYGPVLIGAYRSQWEAIQYRDHVIMNGGY